MHYASKKSGGTDHRFLWSVEAAPDTRQNPIVSPTTLSSAVPDRLAEERFFLGLADGEQTLIERAAELLREGPSPTPTLHDVEAADLVLVLGEDLTNTAPMLDFSVRRWARLRCCRSPLVRRKQGWKPR